MPEMSKILIYSIFFLCAGIIACTIFYFREIQKTRERESERNENRLKLNAVMSQSDAGYRDCDFSNFDEDFEKIKNRLERKNLEDLNILELEPIDSEEDLDSFDFKPKAEKLDALLNVVSSVFLDDEIEDLIKFNDEVDIEPVSNEFDDIEDYNSNFGVIDPLRIRKDYREQFLTTLKNFHEGKIKENDEVVSSVEIKVPVEKYDKRGNKYECWMKIIFIAINKDADGKVLKAISLNIDVTSQERSARDYEDTIKYNFTQKQFPLYTRLNLSNGKVRECNLLLKDFYEVKEEQTSGKVLSFLQKTIRNNGQNRDVDLNQAFLAQKFRAGERELKYSFFYKFSNSELHWFDLHIKLVSNLEKDEIEAICYFIDTTNQNISLVTKDDVLNEDVDYIFWMNKVTGVCKFINKSETVDWIKNIDSIDYDEFVNLFLQKTITDSDKESVRAMFNFENIDKELSQNDEYKFSYHARKEDGSVEIKQQKVYYYEKNSNILIYVCIDITAIALMQNENSEKLAEAIKQAELANASKSQFLSRMSHDLRTPMNGVIGIAELAKKELNNPDALLGDINKILSSSIYMVSLLNDILDMSKIESGKMQIAVGPTNLGDMLESINTLSHVMCDEKGINFYCNLNPANYKNYIINIDRVHAQQVVMNLISNASKFTPHGGQIEFLLESKPLENGKVDVKVVVRDTGSGMSADFQKIMYDAFIQDSNSVNKVGTGLGLTIVHSLVKLMGGKISCVSAPGEGTEFTINVVVDKIESQDGVPLVLDSSAEEKYKTLDLTNKKALLVEDNELNQEIASRLLQGEGITVDVACNGLDALNVFSEKEENYYDVILMDVMMPVMDGLQSTKLLRGLMRKDVKTIPIIAMTANAFVEDIKNCLNAGMTTHLSKPIDKEKMFATIRRCIFEHENN